MFKPNLRYTVSLSSATAEIVMCIELSRALIDRLNSLEMREKNLVHLSLDCKKLDCNAEAYQLGYGQKYRALIRKITYLFNNIFWVFENSIF